MALLRGDFFLLAMDHTGYTNNQGLYADLKNTNIPFPQKQVKSKGKGQI
jgi:hypothetical protein